MYIYEKLMQKTPNHEEISIRKIMVMLEKDESLPTIESDETCLQITQDVLQPFIKVEKWF